MNNVNNKQGVVNQTNSNLNKPTAQNNNATQNVNNSQPNNRVISKPIQTQPGSLPATKPVVNNKTVNSVQQPANITKPVQSNAVARPSTPTQPVQTVKPTPQGIPMSKNVPNVSPTPGVAPSQANQSDPLSNFGFPLEMGYLLNQVIVRNASDLHIVAGYPPLLRIDGNLVPMGTRPMSPDDARKLVYSILTDSKKDILEVNKEVDFAYSFERRGRFRVNAYYMKGTISAALRLIPSRIKTIRELYLPNIYHSFADYEQGFVLVTGPTGHGKSTTLAAIINEINVKYPKHILTIEDPIEYLFPPAKSLVTQREMEEDTNSWKIALRSALREDPDVVLIGEMRDYETIESAITIAETGHLVFATLHTNNAAQTIDRIIAVFPAEQQNKIRAQLADVLRAVVSQRLIPVKGGGRRAVAEVMLINSAVRSLIREGKSFQLDNVIRTSSEEGMISMERSLVNLVRQGLITMEEAKRYALYPKEVERLFNVGL